MVVMAGSRVVGNSIKHINGCGKNAMARSLRAKNLTTPAITEYVFTPDMRRL
jgi:hypothetical protein